MSSGRILVVDDLPDVRATLSGLLADEGYLVRSAGSLAEARELVKTERFHIAVLDVRLDESDVDNVDGLNLMREIRTLDPSVAIIILTGYANVEIVREALEPDNTGRAPAVGFLEKSKIIDLLPNVQRVFDTQVRINPALTIDLPEPIWTRLTHHLRFAHLKHPTAACLREEIDELLRKLFYPCEKITVRPMSRGLGGTAVLEVIPYYHHRGEGERLITKLGEHILIEREQRNYNDLVRGQIGGHRLPIALEEARTHSLAGIIYTFVGQGASQDFVDFGRTASIAEVLQTINNLFLETCLPWRRGPHEVLHRQDLRDIYFQLLRLNADNLTTSLERMMSKRHPFRRNTTGPGIWLGDQLLVDPVAYVLTADLRTDSDTAIIHGDLNGYNVLVDRHQATWLIDFANTCRGPLAHDYACFETSIRLDLAADLPLADALLWEQALLQADLQRPVLPPNLAKTPRIAAAQAAVEATRQLAWQAHTSDTERAYLIALLFNALKLMTVMNFEPQLRDRALVTAAFIAARLQTDTSRS
jgi:CheY-like chemotaxis protein